MAPTLRARKTSDPRVALYEAASAGPSTPSPSRKRRAVTPTSDDDGTEEDDDAEDEDHEDEEVKKPAAKKARAKSTKAKTAPTPAGGGKPPRPEWRKQYEVLLAQRERAFAESMCFPAATSAPRTIATRIVLALC